MSDKAADIGTAVEKEGSGYGGGIYDFLKMRERALHMGWFAGRGKPHCIDRGSLRGY